MYGQNDYSFNPYQYYVPQPQQTYFPQQQQKIYGLKPRNQFAIS